MYLFRYFRKYVSDIIKTIYLYKYSSLFNTNPYKDKPRIIISMIDGRIHHGGLCDRLCGIVSTYNYCKEHNIPFKLFFNYPYSLYNYLEPNKYNWFIQEKDITFNPFYVSFKRICLFGKDFQSMKSYLDFRMSGTKKTTLMYTNMYYFKDVNDFSASFNELFKPSNKLKSAIDYNLSCIAQEYVSITFRFQQLLGDFKETGFKILKTKEEKDKLINLCLNAIEYIYEKHKCKILITSESKSFLSIAKEKFNYVYVIPGNVIHIDFVNIGEKISDESQIKSFVDFYMLSKAKTIYLANIPPLYCSSFPKVASFINKRPYKEITYKNNKFKIIDKSGIIY